ncbi:MAG: hypothetical protein P4L92_02660 [Rudaea sp.]|nr:hypothetical protein [Rudaea sp.]
MFNGTDAIAEPAIVAGIEPGIGLSGIQEWDDAELGQLESSWT